LQSGGTLTTGSGGLTINKTGVVNVGNCCRAVTGTLNANGDVTVNGGVLQVFSGSQFNLASGKTLHIANGGTAYFESFNINGSSIDFVAGSLSYAGNLLVGSGGPLGFGLNLGASRQLTLSGTSTVDTVLVLLGGTLHTGALVNNGYLAVASGILTTGAASLAAAGTLEIDLIGTARNTQYGALVATGAVGLAGRLVVYSSNFSPAVGDSFDILDWGTLTGTFSSMGLPGLSAGRAWDTSKLYTTGVISVVATASVAGDYNGNGVVDAADYVVWRKGLGATYTQNDYSVWRSRFGSTSGSGAGATATRAVPEPTTLGLLMFAATVWCFRRCRAT
jgi:hypothetical protein